MNTSITIKNLLDTLKTNEISYPTLKTAQNNIVLYHITTVTFDEKDKNPRREAFENVIGTIRESGVNFIYLIIGDSQKVSFYFGLVRDLTTKKELPMALKDMGDILKASILGNFRGSKLEQVGFNDLNKVLNSVDNAKRFAFVDGVPSLNDTDDKNNYQGVDRLINVMQGDEFALCVVAQPLPTLEFDDLENQIYAIYNKLSLKAKQMVQGSINTSTGISESSGLSNSASLGTNSSISRSASISKNVGSSSSESHGSSEQISIGSSESSGKNYSKTTGVNDGTSKEKNSINYSKGTSESATEGTNTNKSTSYNKSVGNNSSTSSSTNVSTSESSSKSKTEGTSSSTTTGTSHSNTESQNEGRALSVSADVLNKKYQDYLKYCDDIIFPMLDCGKNKGLYITNTYLFAKDNATIAKLGNNFVSLFSGKKKNQCPLKVNYVDTNDDYSISILKNFQIPRCSLDYLLYDRINYDYDAIYESLLRESFVINQRDNCLKLGHWCSSQELSVIAGLPQKEVAGLSLREEVDFGLNVKNSNKSSNDIILGKLIQNGNELDIDVSIDKDVINKHIFVTGVTGSGKTTTCQKLLLESKLPFLVIEPAKTEYRILKDNEETKDVLIFTLGKDSSAPFRLNPFEFFPHESISSRIDMLKAAINASFDMEAAIPQLIEAALQKCYQQKGWDINTNKNYKYEDPFAKGVDSFPTLKDLIDCTAEIVNEQGFDERLKNDYIGSIRARLQSLLVGSKGMLLNVSRGVDFEDLIEHKVVLEIEEIKNGDEKSLIMAFILTNLVEALKAKYYKGINFKHITLIEEAHRLLSKYQPGDSPNRKQGVEMFADIISEVRKYGESLVIADQIPNKLISEVLKNTNTKIVHKLFASDDKDAIGNTIALSDEQKNFLSSLDVGRAVVFSQGWEKAIQLQIKSSTNTTSDRRVLDTELLDSVIDYYYKTKSFYGMSLFDQKPSKEQFEWCKFFSNKPQFKSLIKSVEDLEKMYNFISKSDKNKFINTFILILYLNRDKLENNFVSENEDTIKRILNTCFFNIIKEYGKTFLLEILKLELYSQSKELKNKNSLTNLNTALNKLLESTNENDLDLRDKSVTLYNALFKFVNQDIDINNLNVQDLLTTIEE